MTWMHEGDNRFHLNCVVTPEKREPNSWKHIDFYHDFTASIIKRSDEDWELLLPPNTVTHHESLVELNRVLKEIHLPPLELEALPVNA